MNKNSKSRY